MPDATVTSRTKRTVLGSGDAYLKEVDGTIDTSDVDALINTYFVDGNRFGDTKNGANFTYTPTKYVVEDDLGRIMETYLTKEEVKLALGSVTVNPDMLKVLMETARVDTTVTGKTYIKVGGLDNATGKSFFVGFKHINKRKGNIYVMIIGKNDGELAFSFNPESETILNPTFTASAMDTEGTKIIIVFDKPAADAITGD